VLGLLTTSVKAGFDAAYSARGDHAGKLAALDRCLRDYGPETAHIRDELRSYVAAVIASTWPDEPSPKGVTYPDTSKMARTGEVAARRFANENRFSTSRSRYSNRAVIYSRELRLAGRFAAVHRKRLETAPLTNGRLSRRPTTSKRRRSIGRLCHRPQHQASSA
jgi:hypothetical protein